MNNTVKARYLNLLAKEMVAMYGLSIDVAIAALKESAINTFINEHPEYVDHVPLSNWAEEVHAEMFS